MSGTIPGTATLLAWADDVYARISRLPDQIRRARVRGSVGHDSVVAHAGGTGALLAVEVSETFSRHADAHRLAEYLLLAIQRAEIAADEYRAGLLDDLPDWVRPDA